MEAVRRLGDVLRAAGFGGERHSALAELPGPWPAPQLLEAAGLGEDARLAGLLALLRDGDPFARAEAQALVAPAGVDELVAAGVLETDGDRVRSPVTLNAISGTIVAGDHNARWGGDDFVAGISSAGKGVAYVTVRRDVDTAVDLGTGSGVQALLAARHAREVVAVDINEHALRLGATGAALNGIDNVEWVSGDWAEPVRGRRFDLVICNPPIVISPDMTILARDSALGGEGISRQMVGEAAALLADGGFASVLCSWALGPGESDARPLEWAQGTGCDALLVHLETLDSLTYATSNVAGHAVPDPATIAEGVERWVEHYARENIEQIAMGVVVLRRRAGSANWARVVAAPGEPSGPASAQLERIFAGIDVLEACGGSADALLAARWRAADGHRLDQALTFGDGGYAAGEAVLSEAGLNVRAQVDARIAHVVVGCDGRATLAELAPPGLEPLCAQTVADLLAKGFLIPA